MADRWQRRSPRVNSLVVGGGGGGGGRRLLRGSKCMRLSENLKSRCSEMPL